MMSQEPNRPGAASPPKAVGRPTTQLKQQNKTTQNSEKFSFHLFVGHFWDLFYSISLFECSL